MKLWWSAGISGIFQDVKTVMKIVGEVFNKEAVAQDYVKYFDNVLRQVQSVVGRIPQEKRPKVLYCDVKEFYAHFFKYTLSDNQVKEILSGQA